MRVAAHHQTRLMLSACAEMHGKGQVHSVQLNLDCQKRDCQEQTHIDIGLPGD